MPTIENTYTTRTYASDPIAAASSITIDTEGFNTFDIVVEPDVAGTGAADITAAVGNSGSVLVDGVTSFDIASPSIKRLNGRFKSITITGNTIVTSTAFTITVIMS